MPKLLSGQVLRAGGSGQYISLPNTQPALGPSPSTTTGFTLVTDAVGVTSYSNILGNIIFSEGSLTNFVPDQNISITAAGTGTFVVNAPTIFNDSVVFANTFSFVDVTATGHIQFTGGFNSTGIDSGTLVVQGGIGVSEDVYVGGTINIAGILEANGTVNLSPEGANVNLQPSIGGTVVISPAVTGDIDNMDIGTITPKAGKFVNLESTVEMLVSSETASTGTSTGALIVKGGVGVAGNVYATGLYASGIYDNNLRVISQINTSAGLSGGGNGPALTLTNTGVLSVTAGTGTFINTSTGDVVIWTTGNTLQVVTEQGNTTNRIVRFDNTTNATTSTTGSVVIAGGLGVGLDIFVGGNIYADNLSPDVVQAQLGIFTATQITGTYANTSTLSDNPLYVSGGAGIGTNLTVGGNALIYGNLTVFGTQTIVTSTVADIGRKVVALSTSAGPAILSIDSGITVGPISSPFVKFLFDGINAWKSTGNIVPVTAGSYNLGSASTQWNTVYSQSGRITGSTPSTSPITGALTVIGGVGIGGSIYAAGPIHANSTIDSTSTNTGAVIINGGLGIAKSAYVGGQVRIASTTNATSTLTGALQVAGGAGFQGTVYAVEFANLAGEKFITTGTLASYGVTYLTAGTGTAISTSTGFVTVWNTATLQSITDNNAETNNVVTFSNTTNAVSSTTGAVVISGGLGIEKNLYVGGDAVIYGNVTFTGAATNVLTTNTVFTDNLIELHKPNGSTWAVNDGKDIGTTYHYYDGTGDGLGFLGRENSSGYLEWIGTGTEVGSVFTGTYGTFKTGAIKLVSGIDSTGTTNGALTVLGGIGVAGDIQAYTIYSNGSPVLTSASIGNYGVSVLQAGTDTAISDSTGDITIWNTSTLQTVTDRGSITNNAVTIANTLTVYDLIITDDDLSSTPHATLLLESNARVGYTSITLANTSLDGQSFTFDVGGSFRSGQDGAAIDEGNFTLRDNVASAYRLIVAKVSGNILVNSEVDDGVNKLQVSGSFTATDVISATTGSFQTVNVVGTSTVNDVMVQGILDVTSAATFHNGLVSESTSTFSNTVVIGSSALETSVTPINTTGPTQIDSFDATLYRSARNIVQITDGDDFHLAEIILLHDNAGQVHKSEYGIILTNGALGEFNAELDSGYVKLYFTAYSGTNKTVNVVRTAIGV